ncbi:MAG: hypothetical protein WCK63_08875 [Betaproteobacteria bacterium]
MNHLQKWFEKIAGITQEERARWELAQEVFSKKKMDVAAFQKPACWRRRSFLSATRQN